MTVTNVHKDPETLTMAITAEFDAPVDRVWETWADPRLLERWWGPPTYPATFIDHDLSVGGRATYCMTGPEGDRPHGWWRVIAIEAPHRLEFENGFADENGTPSATMPVMVMRVSLIERPTGGTRMDVVATFSSVGAMEQIMAMGMEEGMKAAMSQIGALV
ncbi:MAG TPA: SRPBCC domain-containing protein [Acidimicrobiales bacterium]|nr:SRPBCC domain-containing protein [Acidimicrobiales bacterium]